VKDVLLKYHGALASRSTEHAVPGSLEKKAEEDVTFCFIQDGIFRSPFLSNEPGTGLRIRTDFLSGSGFDFTNRPSISLFKKNMCNFL
jgi:hypothetical protein